MELERYKKYLNSIFKFMCRQHAVKIAHMTVILHTNIQKTDCVLVKTGYYDPNTKKIHLFLCDDKDFRAPKDVYRSFCHEMIHAFQDLYGVIDKSGYTSDKITEDKNLVKLEAEAYLKGNFALRQWTENLQKNLKK